MRAEVKEEDEREQKSRQGNSSSSTGKPNAFAAPTQRLRKRKLSFDATEESSKRRRAGPLHPSQAVGEPAMAAEQ